MADDRPEVRAWLPWGVDPECAGATDFRKDRELLRAEILGSRPAIAQRDPLLEHTPAPRILCERWRNGVTKDMSAALLRTRQPLAAVAAPVHLRSPPRHLPSRLRSRSPNVSTKPVHYAPQRRRRPNLECLLTTLALRPCPAPSISSGPRTAKRRPYSAPPRGAPRDIGAERRQRTFRDQQRKASALGQNQTSCFPSHGSSDVRSTTGNAATPCIQCCPRPSAKASRAPAQPTGSGSAKRKAAARRKTNMRYRSRMPKPLRRDEGSESHTRVANAHDRAHGRSGNQAPRRQPPIGQR